jgi:hypothetical protein
MFTSVVGLCGRYLKEVEGIKDLRKRIRMNETLKERCYSFTYVKTFEVCFHLFYNVGIFSVTLSRQCVYLID